MAGRIPPQDLNAERTALGAILLRGEETFTDVIDYAGEEDFYDPHNREIFAAIKDLAQKSSPIDLITVSDQLKKRGTLKTVGGRAYVGSLSSDVPSVSNASEYAKIVHNKAILRRLIQISGDIQTQSYDGKMPAEAILENAESAIFEIAQSHQTHDYSMIGEVLVANMARIDEACKREGKVGLETGFIDLDNKIGGFQKSTLNILAARPGMGKTALALNIAKNTAKKGKSVMVFSLEMGKEELGARLHSMEARISSTKLRTGELLIEEWDQLNQAVDDLSMSKLAIDETAAISILEMKNKCRRFKAKNGLDLVIVDYLQLMEAEGENRQQEVSKLSRNLKLMSKEMDCPFLVLSQLSRGPEARTDKRPLLSDLRESGSIEQDADIVMFLYNDEYYNGEDSDEKGITEVHIAKHRAGPTGTIKLGWRAEYTEFVNLTGEARLRGLE
ncbi:MAG: replicative DNA helicase [Clostridiales bacterium]|nr:replicative DNA helicase [Clostridiales bacterium]MDD7347352.1 replicative DNA helicase [Clostridiales bacterium]MDY4060201.1 replicative DNA helicase [Anaerovoracaceae bacterium]